MDNKAQAAAGGTAAGTDSGAVVVADSQRLRFLPDTFGPQFLHLEHYVYAFANRLIDGYNGAYWEFLRLPASHGSGGYLRPVLPEPKHVAVSCEFGNGFHGEMTADAAGIVVTLFALSHLTFARNGMTGTEVLVDRYHQLLRFSWAHPEASMIQRAID